MKPGPVAAHRLEGMGEGVAVVQHGAQPGFLALVLLDDAGLQLAGARDELPHRGRVASQHLRCTRFQERQEVRVEDHAVVDHLARPLRYSRRCNVSRYAVSIHTPTG